jgi:hypothetical protein
MNVADKEYWKIEQPHPYAPSHEDLNHYKKNLLQGTILLLGVTHKLLPIANNIIDIDPWYFDDRVIKADWRSNQTFYDNIIGDGVLNFTNELADGVINMASQYSKRLIVRSFAYRLDKMIIAKHFPKKSDFIIKPCATADFKDYYFYVWDF